MDAVVSGNIRAAIADLTETVQKPATWITLGWLDLKRQYRRTFLGPLWLTLSTAILICSFALIWSQVFGNPIREYLPRVAVGFIMFNLMSQFVVDGSKSLIASSIVISQTRLPLLSVIFRQSCFFIFVFMHHFLVLATIVVVLIPMSELRALEALGGITLVIINCVLCQIWLSVICMRFRDLPLVFANVMQILFFVSPVMWLSRDLTGLTAELLQYNPVAIGIEIVRSPLVGFDFDFFPWVIGCCYTAANFFLAGAVFIHLRRHVAYWV